MKTSNKAYTRLDILKIIDSESEFIKKSTDRRRYWQKVLKDLDNSLSKRQLKFPISMGGEK